VPVEPYISSMIARQEEFNASVNLLMSAKVRDLHHVQYHGLRELLNPWLGDYVRLLPSHLHQISVRHEHRVVLSVTKIEIIVLQCWDLSQLASFYAYPLRDVRGDQCILEVPWNVVVVNCASQRWDVIR
jgi:hypothetical protein